jgi:Na+/H+ antiporter NhaD/arsenite permease-like protein
LCFEGFVCVVLVQANKIGFFDFMDRLFPAQLVILQSFPNGTMMVPAQARLLEKTVK